MNRLSPNGAVSYVGIAADEPARFHSLTDTKRSPLVEAGWTEEDCRRWCEENDLLSPIYTTATRGGCWFCPNAKRKELRHLYDHHPELWNRMLELQAIPGKVSEKFDRKRRFSDIDALFRQEDACNEAAGKAA